MRGCSRTPVEGPVAVQPARRRVPRCDSALRVIDGERLVVEDLPVTRDNSHRALEHKGKSAEMVYVCKSTAAHAVDGEPAPGAVGLNVWIAGEGHRGIVEEQFARAVGARAEVAHCDAAKTCRWMGHHGQLQRGAAAPARRAASGTRACSTGPVQCEVI